MLRLDPSGSSFTSTHVLLSRLCLHARAYAVALPIIDKDICHFSTGSDQVYLKRSRPLLCAQHQTSATFITHASGFSAKLSYRDHLQYFLYGSMIYMGLKQWGKALHFLSVVISAPCVNSVSMIMVEAYKKWVLVSLLEKGAVSFASTPLHELLELTMSITSLFPYLMLPLLRPQRYTGRLPDLMMHLEKRLKAGILID